MAAKNRYEVFWTEAEYGAMRRLSVAADSPADAARMACAEGCVYVVDRNDLSILKSKKTAVYVVDPL